MGEDEIAEAMVLLMERAKLVVEGAGAVGVAALLGGQVGPPPRARRSPSSPAATSTPGLLAVDRAAPRDRGRPPRRAVHPRADRPGNLAEAARLRGRAGANIVDVSHVREGVDLHVRETAVELVIETRGHEHASSVVAALDGAGYVTRVIT